MKGRGVHAIQLTMKGRGAGCLGLNAVIEIASFLNIDEKCV
jgi:hypothetical protein